MLAAPLTRFTLHPLTPERQAEAAQFMAATVALDPAYISHGEIQTGLSADGLHWDAALERHLLADLREDDADRHALLALDAAGAICGLGILAVLRSRRRCYGVVEDMAVAPQCRGFGIGTALLAALEAEARQRGADWVFLESGRNNDRAHGFFDGCGYRSLSKVFGKPL